MKKISINLGGTDLSFPLTDKGMISFGYKFANWRLLQSQFNLMSISMGGPMVARLEMDFGITLSEHHQLCFLFGVDCFRDKFMRLQETPIVILHGGN
jgi:hypothetical protein